MTRTMWGQRRGSGAIPRPRCDRSVLPFSCWVPELDLYNPIEDAIEAAAQIPNATLVRVAGHGGHAVAADSSPEIADVRRAIDEFLVRCIGQT